MLNAAGLLNEQDVSPVVTMDGKSLLVVNDDLVARCLNGQVPVTVIEHFTTLPGQSNVSVASTHDTVAARRFNWAVVRSLCAERLSFAVPRDVDHAALAGATNAVAWILHEVSLLVNGGAFAGRSHEQQALRAAALLAPLQQQTALMALLIAQQQEQWKATQRVRDIANFHRQQLMDTIAEEAELRARIEHQWRYDRNIFFVDLTTFAEAWCSGRELIAKQQLRRFVAILDDHHVAIRPIAYDNFKRLARVTCENQETDARAFVNLKQAADWAFVIWNRDLTAVETDGRAVIANAEAQWHDDLMRRVFCYFETIVNLDATRIQENARREVLETYALQTQRRLQLEAIRIIPQVLLAAKRVANEQRLANPIDYPALTLSNRGRQFWEPLERDRLKHVAKCGRPPRRESSSDVTDLRASTNSLRGSNGSRERHALIVGVDGRVRLAGLIPAPMPKAFAHLLDAKEASDERRRATATPDAPPATPMETMQASTSRPPSQIAAADSKIKYLRTHLPRHPHKTYATLQTFCRYRLSVLLSLQRFYRTHSRLFLFVQRRWAFVSLEYPRLRVEREETLTAMQRDNVTYNRSLKRLVFGPAGRPPTARQSALIVSAIVKRTAPSCRRCLPILLAAEPAIAAWGQLRASSALDAHHRWEAEVLRWDQFLCRACSAALLSVAGIDATVERKHALKSVLTQLSSIAKPTIVGINDTSVLATMVSDAVPQLAAPRWNNAIARLCIIQAACRGLRSCRHVAKLQSNRLLQRFTHKQRTLQLLTVLQARWKLVRRLRQQTGARCRCECVFEMLQRRSDGAFEHYVPADYEKRLHRRKPLSEAAIVKKYEPWIVHHRSTYDGVNPADAYNVDLLFVDPHCSRVRAAYFAALNEWRRSRKYALRVFFRLKFLAYLRKTREGYKDRHQCCISGREEPHHSPHTLDLLKARLQRFPGFVVSQTLRHRVAWENYRRLVNRHCALCYDLWLRLREWARDQCAIAEFVHVRFRFVIMRRNEVDEARRRRMEPFRLRDDWMLCVRCASFLQRLRQHLTYQGMLSESRITVYARHVCHRCMGPLRVFLAPFIHARRAALFVQCRWRWLRAWRKYVRTMARRIAASATRGGCVRCAASTIYSASVLLWER
jgi:hypothetical protein